jgi:predicted secreted Zn-dependent protease
MPKIIVTPKDKGVVGPGTGEGVIPGGFGQGQVTGDPGGSAGPGSRAPADAPPTVRVNPGNQAPQTSPQPSVPTPLPIDTIPLFPAITTTINRTEDRYPVYGVTAIDLEKSLNSDDSGPGLGGRAAIAQWSHNIRYDPYESTSGWVATNVRHGTPPEIKIVLPEWKDYDKAHACLREQWDSAQIRWRKHEEEHFHLYQEMIARMAVAPSYVGPQLSRDQLRSEVNKLMGRILDDYERRNDLLEIAPWTGKLLVPCP